MPIIPIIIVLGLFLAFSDLLRSGLKNDDKTDEYSDLPRDQRQASGSGSYR